MLSGKEVSSVVEKKFKDKAIVIQYIFDQLYDYETKKLERAIVTITDVQNAKKYCAAEYKVKLKTDGQGFNFFKDIVRSVNAVDFWPQKVRDEGFTGGQKTGGGDVFKFIPLIPGQIDPLALDFLPSDCTQEYAVQSLSLPIASKALGRKDESWLLQVAVNLRIIETHFAVGSNHQIDALEISHLQMDIKLRTVQIDALFIAQYSLRGEQKSALITVEAKQANQRILPEQISRQVMAAFAETKTELVIPIAIATAPGSKMFVVEFKSVERKDKSEDMQLTFHRDALYRLSPQVKGISSR